MISVPRTCHDYEHLGLISRAGFYDVDPDGFDQGVDPFKVFCEPTKEKRVHKWRNGSLTFENEGSSFGIIFLFLLPSISLSPFRF